MLAISLLNACNKDSNSTKNTGTITCKIDGVDWSASGDLAAITVQQGITNITGKAADGTIVTISIQGEGVGTFALAEGGDHAGIYSKGDGSASFSSNQGSDATAKCIISKVNTSDSTMTGTFQFTAFRLIDGTQVKVTDGKFTNVKFATEVTNTTAGFFKCKIDGTQFNAGIVAGQVPGQYLMLVGSASIGVPSIGLNLDPNIAVGVTNFDGVFGTNFAQYNPNSSTFLSSDSGKVTITKHDKAAKLIEGTFEFEATELGSSVVLATITDGSFSIKY